MITLQLQPEIESALLAEAHANGEDISTFVEKLLRPHLEEVIDLPRTAAEQARIEAAIDSIRELRKDNILKPYTIRELIDEGRKY